MATLETSPEANCDRQTGRQAGRQKHKATYRGSTILPKNIYYENLGSLRGAFQMEGQSLWVAF